MFQPTTVDPATPDAVKTFVRKVVDLCLGDVLHAMLSLPLPEAQIAERFAVRDPEPD